MIAGLFAASLILTVITASPDVNTTYYTLIDVTQKLVPSNTSAVLTSVLWPDLSQPTSVKDNIPSDIRCCFEAEKARALAFTFEGETCSLFGPGGPTTGQVSVYQTVLFPLGDSLEEVARGKATNSSEPNSADQTSEKAVDGTLTEDSTFLSRGLINPWWQVDLEEERQIYQIQIFPRRYSNQRFHDIEVRVGKDNAENGNFSSYSLLCTYTKNYVVSEGHLLCSRYEGVTGRYVSIQITAPEAEILQISDVSIYALKK